MKSSCFCQVSCSPLQRLRTPMIPYRPLRPLATPLPHLNESSVTVTYVVAWLPLFSPPLAASRVQTLGPSPQSLDEESGCVDRQPPQVPRRFMRPSIGQGGRASAPAGCTRGRHIRPSLVNSIWLVFRHRLMDGDMATCKMNNTHILTHVSLVDTSKGIAARSIKMKTCVCSM